MNLPILITFDIGLHWIGLHWYIMGYIIWNSWDWGSMQRVTVLAAWLCRCLWASITVSHVAGGCVTEAQVQWKSKYFENLNARLGVSFLLISKHFGTKNCSAQNNVLWRHVHNGLTMINNGSNKNSLKPYLNLPRKALQHFEVKVDEHVARSHKWGGSYRHIA